MTGVVPGKCRTRAHDAELVLADSHIAPVVVPVAVAVPRRLEFMAKRGYPESREQFRISIVTAILLCRRMRITTRGWTSRAASSEAQV
jgi:hypothetical protein